MKTRPKTADTSESAKLRAGFRPRFSDGAFAPWGESAGRSWPDLAETIRSLRARLNVGRPKADGS